VAARDEGIGRPDATAPKAAAPIIFIKSLLDIGAGEIKLLPSCASASNPPKLSSLVSIVSSFAGLVQILYIHGPEVFTKSN
jgi:hypothetical protein